MERLADVQWVGEERRSPGKCPGRAPSNHDDSLAVMRMDADDTHGNVLCIFPVASFSAGGGATSSGKASDRRAATPAHSGSPTSRQGEGGEGGEGGTRGLQHRRQCQRLFILFTRQPHLQRARPWAQRPQHRLWWAPLETSHVLRKSSLSCPDSPLCALRYKL